ncbi:antibiotic biosynthesis monooxygenase family protein [Microvirga lenta]|uniref:antibiotic biosynthesis monooxygenase family protein n=1 Tax=Microvirga lenta TaxID=2881337 RepID=UPI001CFFAB02|nr:antibiotic biosynthesis monooxygenase family protein [Microvirga lenta]MCB5174971.1 antibiotic biosynthesis monooxygenase [Microvirga lenta]
MGLRQIIVPAMLAAALPGAGRAEQILSLSDAQKSDGTSFAEQLRSAPTGQIVLLNTFLVPEGEAEAFRQGWARAAEVLRRQPGFVSTTLHRPVGGARLWVNHAVWESASAFMAALASPDFKAAAASMRQTGFRRLYQAERTLRSAR